MIRIGSHGAAFDIDSKYWKQLMNQWKDRLTVVNGTKKYSNGSYQVTISAPSQSNPPVLALTGFAEMGSQGYFGGRAEQISSNGQLDYFVVTVYTD